MLLPLQAMHYPPPDRLSNRAPSVSTGYRAPAVSAIASSFMDDDRLDMAGAGDRTFEDLPPLPAEDWDAGRPPLPEVATAALQIWRGSMNTGTEAICQTMRIMHG